MTEHKCIKCGDRCSGDLYNRIDEASWKVEGPVCLQHYRLTSDDLQWLSGTGRYGQ